MTDREGSTAALIQWIVYKFERVITSDTCTVNVEASVWWDTIARREPCGVGGSEKGLRPEVI